MPTPVSPNPANPTPLPPSSNGKFRERTVTTPPPPHTAPSAGRASTNSFSNPSIKETFTQKITHNTPNRNQRIQNYAQTWSEAIHTANEGLATIGEPTDPTPSIVFSHNTETFLEPRFCIFNTDLLPEDEQPEIIQDLSNIASTPEIDFPKRWEAALAYCLHSTDVNQQTTVINNLFNGAEADNSEITNAQRTIYQHSSHENPIDDLMILANQNHKVFLIQNQQALTNSDTEISRILHQNIEQIKAENPQLNQWAQYSNDESSEIIIPPPITEEHDQEIPIDPHTSRPDINDPISPSATSNSQSSQPSFFKELLRLPFELLVKLPYLGHKIGVLLPNSTLQFAIHHTLNTPFDKIPANDHRRINAEALLKKKCNGIIKEVFMSKEDLLNKIESLLKPPQTLVKTYTLRALLQASNDGHHDPERPAYGFLRENQLTSIEKKRLFEAIGNQIPPKTDPENPDITALRHDILKTLTERMMTAKTNIHHTSVESNKIFWETKGIIAHNDELKTIITNFAFKIDTGTGTERFIQNEGFAIALGQIILNANETEQKTYIQNIATSLANLNLRIDQGYGLLRSLHYARPENQRHLPLDNDPNGLSTQLRRAIRSELQRKDDQNNPIYLATTQLQILQRLTSWGTTIRFPLNQNTIENNFNDDIDDFDHLPSPPIPTLFTPSTSDIQWPYPPATFSEFDDSIPITATINELSQKGNHVGNLLQNNFPYQPPINSGPINTQLIHDQLKKTADALTPTLAFIGKSHPDEYNLELKTKLIEAAKSFAAATANLIPLCATHHETLFDEYLEDLERSTKNLETQLEKLSAATADTYASTYQQTAHALNQTFQNLEPVLNHLQTPLYLGQTPNEITERPPELWSVSQKIQFFENQKTNTQK